MNDVSALEFLSSKEVKLYFFENPRPRILEINPDVNLTREMNASFSKNKRAIYYRVRIKDRIGWYTDEGVRIPRAIEHQFERFSKV